MSEREREASGREHRDEQNHWCLHSRDNRLTLKRVDFGPNPNGSETVLMCLRCIEKHDAEKWIVDPDNIPSKESFPCEECEKMVEMEWDDPDAWLWERYYPEGVMCEECWDEVGA